MALQSETASPAKAPSGRLRWILALVVFGLALGIRLIGIGWGLKNELHNQSYHPDEEVNWRMSRHIEPLAFNFLPGAYNYGTFYLTAMRVADDVINHDSADARSNDWDAIAHGEFAGRLVSALAGAGLAAVVFWIGALLFGEIGGAAAGLLIAFAPGLVMHSRFATVDMFGTFWVAMTALCAVRLLDKEASERKFWSMVVLGGVSAGFAAGTKYTGGLAILMVLTAVVMTRPGKWIIPAAIGALVTVVFFVVTTPGILLDKEAFWRDFKFEQHHVATGHGLLFIETSPGFIFHFENLIAVSSLFALLFGGFFFVRAVTKGDPGFLVFAPFVLVYYLLISLAAVKFARYCFPVVPFLALGLGYLLARYKVLIKTSNQRNTQAVQLLYLVAFGLGFFDLISSTYRGSTQMAGVDPRDEVAKLIRREGSQGELIALPQDPWFWSPAVFPDSTASREFFFTHRQEILSEASAASVSFPQSTDPTVSAAWSPAILQQNPEFVTYSDLESFDLERLKGWNLGDSEDAKTQMANYSAFQSALHKDYILYKTIGTKQNVVEDLRYTSPTVYIWKRKK